MTESPTELAASPEPTEPEPFRVLLPSPIGVLGLEFVDERIHRVVIVPKGRERRLFQPFAELKRDQRTEFIDEALGRFSEYLAGARRRLDLDYDLRASGATGFTRRVLKQATRVPYGRTRTYQEIADGCGRPDAYRQVLAVLMTNPLPLVVPCHRVVTNRSGSGSYIGGAKKKEWLLKMERRDLAVA